MELTANHWGRFELTLCPNNNPAYEASQGCFDRYGWQQLLKVIFASFGTKCPQFAFKSSRISAEY